MLNVAHPLFYTEIIWHDVYSRYTDRGVTIDDKRDVEPALQRSGTVLQHHRVEPRIFLTNSLNLQSVVKVHPQLFHLELGELVY